jgi:hypothetical protein
MGLPKYLASGLIPLLSILSTSAQITILPGQMLAVDFHFQGQPVDQQYGTSVPPPDMLLFNVGGNAPFSETSTTYRLYDGNTLLSEVSYGNASFTWVGLDYVSSSNPYPYFNGAVPNETVDMSGVVDGTINGQIHFVPQFTSPSSGDAMNVSFTLALGLQGGIGGYRPYTAPIISYSVVPVPEPTYGCFLLAFAGGLLLRRKRTARTDTRGCVCVDLNPR